ncbi:PREDICTED: putative uncharacterized protein DDB_G0294196 [Lupinus angustifolius]|uniref:putative uncharacterized protein DDB_G0294196 n=1 Tax=Lupinus angustifolius TaxID=3871 RepID=UPI00092F9369|nr:PREDICTED: putative uncharacterized protein DDB_G0294196 [Lupinus angustifolius]
MRDQPLNLGNMQYLEAHINANVHELNDKINRINEDLEIEKKYSEELAKQKKEAQERGASSSNNPLPPLPQPPTQEFQVQPPPPPQQFPVNPQLPPQQFMQPQPLPQQFPMYPPPPPPHMLQNQSMMLPNNLFNGGMMNNPAFNNNNMGGYGPACGFF